MKTFREFILEVYDPEVQGRSQIRTQGQGGRVGADRKKTDPEKRRTKFVNGKKIPTQYKDRKDIGTQRPKSTREQQPTKERGASKLSPREQMRKARAERLAAKSGGKSSKELTKAADKLLTTKTTKAVDPKYKPQKASGLTQKERDAIRKKGERKLRDLRLQATGKTKESELKYPVTTKEVNRRNKKK